MARKMSRTVNRAVILTGNIIGANQQKPPVDDEEPEQRPNKQSPRRQTDQKKPRKMGRKPAQNQQNEEPLNDEQPDQRPNKQLPRKGKQPSQKKPRKWGKEPKTSYYSPCKTCGSKGAQVDEINVQAEWIEKKSFKCVFVK